MLVSSSSLAALFACILQIVSSVWALTTWLVVLCSLQAEMLRARQTYEEASARHQVRVFLRLPVVRSFVPVDAPNAYVCFRDGLASHLERGMVLVQETLTSITEDVMRRRAFIRSVLEAATVRDVDLP